MCITEMDLCDIFTKYLKGTRTCSNLLSQSHLQSSPMVESQLLHNVEEQARRDVELTNAKRAKLELEESLREYQARYTSGIGGFHWSNMCMCYGTGYLSPVVQLMSVYD